LTRRSQHQLCFFSAGGDGGSLSFRHNACDLSVDDLAAASAAPVKWV
jgi:hypothetical protein